MKLQLGGGVLAMLLVAACSSGATDVVSPTTPPAPSEVSADRVAATVTRSVRALAGPLAAIARCSRRIDDCTPADQMTVQSYVLVVGSLAQDIKVLQASNRVPVALRPLLSQTGDAAAAVLALSEPDARVVECGPGSERWPESRDECARRYQALVPVARHLVDTLQPWDAYRG